MCFLLKYLINYFYTKINDGEPLKLCYFSLYSICFQLNKRDLETKLCILSASKLWLYHLTWAQLSTIIILYIHHSRPYQYK